MGILNVLFRNFSLRSRTRKPTDRVPYPVDFRGALAHRLEVCTACGTCAYVCSPTAIVLQRQVGGVEWRYDAGRCTYCGRCVEYCPTRALSFENEAGRPVSSRDQQLTVDLVAFQHCERCGAELIPMPPETLVRLYRTPEGAAEAADLHRLCDRCRSYRTGERVKSGLIR
jgi:formate hydrogenlyase subunit 6/NADH:ubiquinone oxidoreductase subunit I